MSAWEVTDFPQPIRKLFDEQKIKMGTNKDFSKHRHGQDSQMCNAGRYSA